MRHVWLFNQCSHLLSVDSSQQHSFTMQAAIPLPQLGPRLQARVHYPHVPQVPPTNIDVADAVILSHGVYQAFGPSYPSLTWRILMHFVAQKEATKEEIANTIKYQTALLACDEGLFPN
jgi:hypothetical protein